MAKNGGLHWQNVDIEQDSTWFHLVDRNIYTVIVGHLVNISLISIDKMTDF